MNYGYDSSTPGYKPRRKRQLAADLSQLCAMRTYTDTRGMNPYVEIDAMYPGIRIRRITHLSDTQIEDLVCKADDIFERVMIPSHMTKRLGA